MSSEESDLARFKDVLDSKAVASNLLNDPRGHFTAAFFQHLSVLQAHQTGPTSSKIVFKFPVLFEYLNPTQTLHGGAIATIFDICTSWLLFFIQTDGFWRTYGTTRTLSCAYLRPAMEGEKVILEAETVHVGKRLALLKGVMKRERDGAVIATCEHHKFNTDADTRI